MKTAFVFPGQGSQAIGMGREFYDTFLVAKEIFQQVDDALGQNLSKMIFEGSIDDLNLTENTQPALMAVSMAILAVLKKQANAQITDLAAAVAGHSLGEYSAHAGVGTFSIRDTAILLKTRGQAMQQAVPVGVGAMAAVLGLDLAPVSDLCQTISTPQSLVVSANANSPGQVVISGHKEAVAIAIERATAAGAKRAVLLPVSAPFHCPLMQPTADVMAKALDVVATKQPLLPIYANVTASPVTDVAEIKTLLVQQITGQVRWRETVLRLAADGFEQVVEIGAGKVLTGLNKRIADSLTFSSINTPADIDTFLQANT